MSINPHFRDHINFRDLGGYPSADGRHIRPGMLYRSGGLYLMNDEELAHFKSLGILSVMDFRTKMECDKKPDPYIPGVRFLQYSGLEFKGGAEIDFSPKGMSRIGAEGYEQIDLLRRYYRNMPFDNEAFRITMREIREGNIPLLFHCHTGKDRTGVFAIVLLLALGVDSETVFDDFMLSNEYHSETIEHELSVNRDKISSHPELEELIRMRTGVVDHIGREVISDIESRYGSTEEYFLNEYSLDSSELAKIRDMYLE